VWWLWRYRNLHYANAVHYDRAHGLLRRSTPTGVFRDEFRRDSHGGLATGAVAVVFELVAQPSREPGGTVTDGWLVGVAGRELLR